MKKEPNAGRTVPLPSVALDKVPPLDLERSYRGPAVERFSLESTGGIGAPHVTHLAIPKTTRALCKANLDERLISSDHGKVCAACLAEASRMRAWVRP